MHSLTDKTISILHLARRAISISRKPIQQPTADFGQYQEHNHPRLRTCHCATHTTKGTYLVIQVNMVSFSKGALIIANDSEARCIIVSLSLHY